jgi:hypothetical protein
MSAPPPPGAYLEGIGVLGPGMPSWPAAARVLRGETPWESVPTVLPAPQLLPPAERRRMGSLVRLTLAVGLEACAHAGADPAGLPAVFSSSGGDGQNCHEICQALASAERLISPTRFHNSVHNAAAGYWGIATHATPAANALCAHDASFGAGLLEAVCQVAAEQRRVLLIAYDANSPEPLFGVRPIPDAFAVALVLAPERSAAALAHLALAFSAARADTLAPQALESLRRAIPAARSLPLLERLARGGGGTVVLDYLEEPRLGVELSACR